jgi:5-methyltetrahydropteroyltriglutamate--homocysteine methyltransferase
MRMMFAKEEGVPVEPHALAHRIRDAVADIVRRQSAAGIDIVNDGEMSKPSYATYIKDRLNGFGGESQPPPYPDLVPYPGLHQKVYGDRGRARRKMPGCNGPISLRDRDAVKGDIDNLTAGQAATAGEAGRAPEDLFMSAASPGVVSLFFHNDYYKTQDEYLYAIADAMQYEYEAIANAGLVLQLDCPDLGMGRHVQYAHLSLEEFRKKARLHVEALNHAVRNIAPDQMRMHLCWGNYEAPHQMDVPLADIIDVVFLARPAAISFEAANPRHAHEWTIFEGTKVPEGKLLIPGVIESQSNYIEHPELVAQRIGRYAHLVGRDNLMAATDCGFSIHVGSSGVDPDVVWAKLASLAAGAAIASKKFWP